MCCSCLTCRGGRAGLCCQSIGNVDVPPSLSVIHVIYPRYPAVPAALGVFLGKQCPAQPWAALVPKPARSLGCPYPSDEGRNFCTLGTRRVSELLASFPVDDLTRGGFDICRGLLREAGLPWQSCQSLCLASAALWVTVEGFGERPRGSAGSLSLCFKCVYL